MNRYLRQYRTLVLSTAVFVLAGPAHAIRIEGLGPLQTLALSGVAPTVADSTMQIGGLGTGSVSITPWPKFLPQRFGKQAISGTRHLHPAGPSDRITFTRDAESSPWLLVGTNARRSTSIVGPWQLQLVNQQWLITDGKTRKTLGASAMKAKPVQVNIDKERWCIYLLNAEHPGQQPHVAREAEPQIDWAAVRLHQLQKNCAAQSKN